MPTIGTLTNGRAAVACEHWAATWPLITRVWRLRHPAAPALEIIQALGNASASAGTHGPPGAALDLRTWRFSTVQIAFLVQLLRNAGADATWLRTKAQGFDPHIHTVMDCPCKSPADYQLAAVRQGYNGLGRAGRGGRDDGPPISRRTWAQGLAWLRSELNQSPTIPTTLGGLTVSDANRIIEILTDPANGVQAQLRHVASLVGSRAALDARKAETRAVVREELGRLDVAATVKQAITAAGLTVGAADAQKLADEVGRVLAGKLAS